MVVRELDPKLLPIIDRLLACSNGDYDEAFVRNLVLDFASGYEGAPVQDYVPVLVAKEAGDELRRLHALQPIAS